VTAETIEVDGSRTLPSDVTVIATGSAAPDWLNHSGLAQDENGYALVNAHLQSTSHKNVFAAGDVTTRLDRRHARNGVYAVRAGADLALNLLATLTDQPLNAHMPSERSLNLISCGTGHAIANWGAFSAEGAWAWRWKDKIDREFMARFKRG
jgi:NADH dehydrogenase FAD-containing subunit